MRYYSRLYSNTDCKMKICILVFPNNFRIEFLILDHCAIGGSTSPDETSQRQNNLADSSFSDEREENFESYGENGDVEYEA